MKAPKIALFLVLLLAAGSVYAKVRMEPFPDSSIAAQWNTDGSLTVTISGSLATQVTQLEVYAGGVSRVAATGGVATIPADKASATYGIGGFTPRDAQGAYLPLLVCGALNVDGTTSVKLTNLRVDCSAKDRATGNPAGKLSVVTPPPGTQQ